MRTQEIEREMWLRADPASASVARAFVAQAAKELDPDGAATAALRKATTEAVTEALQRGAPCENGLLSLSVYLEAGCLTTEVRSWGDFRPARRLSG